MNKQFTMGSWLWLWQLAKKKKKKRINEKNKRKNSTKHLISFSSESIHWVQLAFDAFF